MSVQQITTADVIERINEGIAERIGQQRFKIWFKNSTRLVVEDHYLKVGVPNLFIGGWIENHFMPAIQTTANTVLDQTVKVIFTIDPELFGSPRRRQLDSQAKSVSYSTNPALNHRRRRYKQRQSSFQYRLEEFVVGPQNQLAYNACRIVASEPRTHFNPLFIHGGCGLGKTHLLQGLCRGVLEKRPEATFIYASGEEFTNQFILALKTGKVEEFRRRFRQADLLVVDDVHFLASKKATQEEFLHTFKTISMASKQVVLASDAAPKMIGQLSESLVSRFVSGMVVKIEPPDFATRCAILRSKIQRMEKDVPEVVVEYIAENIRANVRELEGALLKLVAYASLCRKDIQLSLAKEALEDHITRTDPIVHLSDIEAVVTTFFGLTPADVHSSRKTRTISLARSLGMYLARKHTSMSFPEIGRFMGDKNHATVILACRKIKNFLQQPDQMVQWQSPAGMRQMKIQELLDKLESSISR